MAGNEQPFCNALDMAVVSSYKAGEDFLYYEIGVGNGDTMEAVHYWLSQRGINHTIVGVDLPTYHGGASNRGWGADTEVQLYLKGAERFLTKVKHKANFIFIDACHGAPCVTRDFLQAEKKIKDGGIICFHDTDPNCQEQHYQDHCKTGIQARKAVEELGLLDDSRSGWKKIIETHGDKSRGGHGALWIQKQKI